MAFPLAVVIGAWCFSIGFAETRQTCEERPDSSECKSMSTASMLQHPKRAPSSDDSTGFHCHEALEEWRRGWSVAKIKWCCENEGIACERVAHAGGRLPSTSGDVIDAQLSLEGVMDVVVEVDTANVSHAGSTSGASMTFEVDESWTANLELCSTVTEGEVVARMVRLPAWPTKMRITALGGNAWGYTSIYLYHTNKNNDTVKIAVLKGTQWNTTTQRGNTSRYWVDGRGSAPKENTYIVPALPEKYSNQQHCTTRTDSRVASMGYTTSPEGTKCVFGVDVQDEGHHCIQEVGNIYGSFGWCYTSTDKGSWGACSANCPLSGQSKILGTKLDEVLRRLNNLQRLGKASAAAASTTVTTTAAQATTARGSTESASTSASTTAALVAESDQQVLAGGESTESASTSGSTTAAPAAGSDQQVPAAGESTETASTSDQQASTDEASEQA
eukprot:TRINITY_DN273_c0_g1_i10.p1 TRINITY_DN273_c0_g1~~TRINITY_DN273_c0_g1_i10.p1  ORF type:complete len:445 (+),score=77.01 TRINITY_DN273_c0_g1_i10:87-1421(+)